MAFAGFALALGLLLLLAHSSGGTTAAVEVRHRVALDPRAGEIGAGVSPAALLIEPRDGIRPVTRFLDHAQRTIFVEAYILSDRSVIRALERAAVQGVHVYVLLEPHPFGLGNQPFRVAAELRSTGVAVRWSSPAFSLTHAKFIVADDRSAIISTANFSRAAFHSNREFLIVDTYRSQARLLSSLFRADWDRQSIRIDDDNVVVSPNDSRPRFVSLLLRAHHSIRLYAEEIADPAMENQLVRLARHGIRVEVLLAWGQTPAAARFLKRGGVVVREYRRLYIHAKVLSVDGTEVFLGSENLSAQSLDENREVGILLRGSSVIAIDAAFDADWRGSVGL